MPLHNIVSLLLPLGVAITIGALAIGFFYRERTGSEMRHDSNRDDSTFDFYPEAGYDTRNQRAIEQESNAESEEKCIICLDPMKRYQMTKTFICSHKYHKKCIESWLRYESFCPACRTVISL